MSSDLGTVGSTESLPAVSKSGRRPVAWNGGADVGLLLLRFAVGGLFFGHGGQKVFGLWGGVGVAGTTERLRGYGFLAQGANLAWGLGIVELVAGAFVVLGVLTPLAAAGLLAIKIVAVVVKWGAPFYAAVAPDALELDVLLGLGAAALVFTGAGRVSLDNGRTWQRRPLPYAWLSLVIAVAVALVVLLTLRR